VPRGQKKEQKNGNGARLGFEETLWQAADKQEKATLTVLQQAELLCKDWAA
jgi:hypothetical protein